MGLDGDKAMSQGRRRTSIGVSLMPQTIIGIIGPIGVGKTTLANGLTAHGFIRVSFADSLKEMLMTFVQIQGCIYPKAIELFYGNAKDKPSEYFNGQTPRRAMQTLGTEWGRELIHPDLWIDVWKRRVQNYDSSASIVVDDVRFVYEAEKLRSFGGQIILLQRTGCQPGPHQSEQEFLKIHEDALLQNYGTEKQLLENFWKTRERIKPKAVTADTQ